jgi:hypothetical protein
LYVFFVESLCWVKSVNASGMIGTILRSGSNGLTSDEAQIAEASVITIENEREVRQRQVGSELEPTHHSMYQISCSMHLMFFLFY